MATEGLIKLGDFGSVESKELVEKEIFRRIKPHVGSWVARCYQKSLKAPYKTASFRSVVYPKAKDEQSYVLLEGITPDPTGRLLYTEQTMSVSPRGFYAMYTDEDMTYGFDSIVQDLTSSVSNNAEDVLDQIAYKAWLSGNQVWTADSGLTRELFTKIRISMKKFTRKKGVNVKAILTPEDIADLRLKYNQNGANLFVDTSMNEESIKNGEMARFEGVDIIEDDSECMYEVDTATGLKTGKRIAFFYTMDSEGRSPVAFIKADGESGEFITKGLGEAGDDYLNQRGSIGVKFKGLGAMVTAEEVLARVIVTPAADTIGYVDSSIDEFGNIKADGKSVARANVRDVVGSPIALTIVTSAVSVAKGKNLALKVYDEEGNDLTSTATYATSASGVATVSKGIVTGVAAGEATISVSATGKGSAKVKITVK